MGKKKIFALVILLLGAVGAFLILRTPPKPSSDFITLSKDGGRETGPNLAFESRAITEPKPLSASLSETSFAERNLTQGLVTSYAREIFKRNAEGPQVENGQEVLTVPSEELATQIFEKSLNQELDFARFTVADIKVTKDNSRDAEVQYVRSLANAFQKSFGGEDKNIGDVLTSWFSIQNTKTLENYTDFVTYHIRDLLTIAVPFRWREFHIQNLNLWQKQVVILQTLKNFSDDPFKAAIALQALEDVAEENKNLNIVLEERVKELSS